MMVMICLAVTIASVVCLAALNFSRVYWIVVLILFRDDLEWMFMSLRLSSIG